MGERCEHGAPSSGCIDCLLEGRHAYAYAKGRADERAAIVAWLLTDAPGLADTRAHIAALIRTGCHEVKKEKP